MARYHELQEELKHFVTVAFRLAESDADLLPVLSLFFDQFEGVRKKMTTSDLLQLADICEVQLHDAFTELEDPTGISQVRCHWH